MRFLPISTYAIIALSSSSHIVTAFTTSPSSKLPFLTPITSSFSPTTTTTASHSTINIKQHNTPISNTALYTTDESAPSDYDAEDLTPDEKLLTVDENEEDATIRDALKRELLLIASVTNRGASATTEEKDIVFDLVVQLEALNPTADPAHNCNGEWDLCFSSTQSFRSSPFFMAIRSALGDDNKQIADNGFAIHDRATTASRVGRVRQLVTDDELVSEYDLNVGIVPGFPLTLQGTVVTTASLAAVSNDTWDISVKGTKVKGSNIPFVNQYLDDLAFELPVGDVYSTVTGSVPVSTLKTFYVDEGIRIVRDVDDNYFVFARA